MAGASPPPVEGDTDADALKRKATDLLREGIAAERIHFVGNVMIDTLLAHRERARTLDTVERLGLESGGYAVLTLHRPSNVDSAVALDLAPSVPTHRPIS